MSNRFNDLTEYPEAVSATLEEAAPVECKTLHTGRTAPDSRPHVLFIIDELCEMGGAERVLFKMIRLLPEDLFRCSLITFRINPEAEEVKNISCPAYVLPLKKTYDWNALKVARQIRRFIRQEKVSIVHTFFETSDLWAGPIAKLSGCPVLISSRRDLGILRSFKHRVGYKLLRGLYDSVLAVSPQVREFCIREDGLNPAKVQTLFGGLEMERVANATGRTIMRRRMDIAEAVPVITTVGNIRRVKGIDVLVEAAALVCRKHPNAFFLVAGRKSDEKHCRELEEKVASLRLTENFRFLGSCEDVFSILRMSDVFCLPSRSEGFSNALMEAMACRLPCVATDVGGNREVLRQGETGFIVASEDSQDLAQRLIYLLDDPSLATEMGLRGEEVIQSGFTAQAMMKNLVRVYQELLAAKERN
ncbi:MAG TPA: glycosyltransferase [Candidatus Angelobacter sp.]|nr:glycosyltransferase [Candidatus Angelobacter sp.]